MYHVPLICLDFDGVLHSYTSGWVDAKTIPGPPVPGALEWLLAVMSRTDVRVAVYSSRSSQHGGLDAMRYWLQDHLEYTLKLPFQEAWALVDRIEWPREKPPALVTIDDRALTFTGNWADFPIERLLAFKPWNR